MITNARYGQCASSINAALKLSVDPSLLAFLGIVRAVVGTMKSVQIGRVRATELLILYVAPTEDLRKDPEASPNEVILILQLDI